MCKQSSFCKDLWFCKYSRCKILLSFILENYQKFLEKSQKGPGIFSSNSTGHPDALRKNCPYRSYSGLHFPAFGLNTDRYPRITPNTNTFNRVLCFIGQKMVRYAWNSSQRRKTKNGNACRINIIFDFQIVITVFSSKCFLFLNVILNFRFFY